MSNRGWLLGLALLLPLAASHAQDDEDAELAELLALLEEETEIATNTKLNADFVPGIVTVLQGAQMFALGARTVHDALALVPGVEINRDDLANATLRPRGLDFFGNSGQVKILVNGLDFYRQASGLNNGILFLPIEQVERIEVIRGPGSGVHGDFAFTGLVNIITKSGAREIYAAGGTGGLWTGGVQMTAGGPDQDFQLDLGISTWQSDDLDSDRSFPENDEDRILGHLVARWKGFSFKLAMIDREGVKPGAREDGLAVLDDGYTLELSHEWDLDSGLNAVAWLRHGDNDMASNDLQFFEGGRSEVGADVAQTFGRHRMLAQASIGRRETTGLTLPPPGIPGGRPPPPPVRLDLDQDTASFLLQDEIDLDPVTVTLGARYDRIEDFDSRVSPRAAAVWRLDDSHTLKAQYAEGYRSATAFEETQTRNALPPGDIGFEVIEVSEIQYLYRTPEWRAKLALYTGQVSDLTRPGTREEFPPGPPPMPGQRPPPPPFTNSGEVDFDGVEAEFTWTPSPRWTVIANASVMDSEVNANNVVNDGGPSFAQADYLANFATVFEATEDWTLGLHYNRVGDRELTEGDSLDGYDQVNLSATWRPRSIEGFAVRGLVRNALDDDIVHVQFRAPGRVIPRNFDGRIYQLEMMLGW
ncbi:MAG: TonB-dependent receptor [Pseudomonadota bacterium]